MAENLKRCPFCGGEATIRKYVDGSYCVTCDNCNMVVMTPVADTEERAIELWNNRPNNWHTGTPTKEDWYFVMWKDTDDNWTRFSALLWNNGNKTWYDDVTPETNWGDEYHAEVIAWMPIPLFKGEEA